MSKTVKKILDALNKQKPAILIGTGIAGFIATDILVIKGTVDALDVMDRRLREEGDDPNDYCVGDIPKKFTFKDKVKMTWKCYIPSIVGTVTSAGSVIGGAVSQKKETIIATAACEIAETSLNQYKRAVEEKVEPEVVKEIKKTVAQESVNKNPPSEEKRIYGKGSTLCKDSITGRYFYSDFNTIVSVVNSLNKQLLTNDDIFLTDLFEELGMPRCDISDRLGWTSYETGLIEVDLTEADVTEDGRPCLVLNYNKWPRLMF